MLAVQSAALPSRSNLEKGAYGTSWRSSGTTGGPQASSLACGGRALRERVVIGNAEERSDARRGAAGPAAGTRQQERTQRPRARTRSGRIRRTSRAARRGPRESLCREQSRKGARDRQEAWERPSRSQGSGRPRGERERQREACTCRNKLDGCVESSKLRKEALAATPAHHDQRGVNHAPIHPSSASLYDQ